VEDAEEPAESLDDPLEAPSPTDVAELPPLWVVEEPEVFPAVASNTPATCATQELLAPILWLCCREVLREFLDRSPLELLPVWQREWML